MKDYTFNLKKTAVRASTGDFQNLENIIRLTGVF